MSQNSVKEQTKNKSSQRAQMLELTFPLVKLVLKRHGRGLLLLIALSLLLGTIPTLQSELESGVFEQVNSLIRTASNQKKDIISTFKDPLTRFSSTEQAEANGVPEKLASRLFQNIDLAQAFLSFLILVLASYFITFWSKKIQAIISKDFFSSLRREGMVKGLQIDPSNVPDLIPGVNDAGQFASAIQQGASNVSTTYGYILEAGQYMFALLSTLYLIWTKSWVFALCCLGMVSIQVIISLIQAKRLRTKRKELDKTRNELVGQSDDILGKREIIAAFEQEENFVHKLNANTEKYADVDKELEVREQKFRGLSDLVTDYSRLLIIAVALLIAFQLGWATVNNVGDVYFMISIYTKIYVPVYNLASRYDSFKRSEATSETFLAVLSKGKDAQLLATSPAGQAATDWKVSESIRFQNVSFTYAKENTKSVLDDCTFDILGNKTTLLLGPSGCGKTTIAKLLLKFWPLQIGSIGIGGNEIRQFSSTAVRSKMSYVSQGDFVVDDTIQENLSWGYTKDAINEKKMRQAIAQVCIKDIPGFPDILKAPAKKLSLGQQQRLSVARMMLDESEIVIMDEPLAGVDIFTIRDLFPVLQKLLQERNSTVLMISHRLAFSSFADHVVVMNEKGKIDESGHPKDLINMGGTFSKLYQASIDELKLSY